MENNRGHKEWDENEELAITKCFKLDYCDRFIDKRTDEEITQYILENYNYEKDEYIYIDWNKTGIQYHKEDNLWYCDDVLIYPHQALAILEILEQDNA